MISAFHKNKLPQLPIVVSELVYFTFNYMAGIQKLLFKLSEKKFEHKTSTAITVVLVVIHWFMQLLR